MTSLNSARSKGRDARRIEDLNQIRTALNLYANDNNGNYPAGDFSDVPHLNGTIDDWNVLQTALAPYISKLPRDPIESESYMYIYLGSFIDGWFTAGESCQTTACTCRGKAILATMALESSKPPAHQCTLDSGAEEDPNGIVMQIN